jgi:hypothetical protein
MKCQLDGTREMGEAPRNFDGVRVYKQVKDFLAAIETKAEKKKGTQVPPESENEIKNKKMIQLR